MKICRLLYKNRVVYGLVDRDIVRVIVGNEVPGPPKNLAFSGDSIPFSDAQLLPPVSPSKIVCVGRNYADHAKELGNKVPDMPLLFLKAPSSLIASGEDIRLPAQSGQVEHEAELGVVIGQNCKNIGDSDNPMDCVYGFTCLNDVTARDLQRSDVQFTRAKSFDSFCPVGPFIETELDTRDLRISTRVNDETRQDGRTSQMIFDIPYLIRYISRQMTLIRGDLIATGTPAGVSQLRSGDICEIEIEGIGILRNSVTE